MNEKFDNPAYNPGFPQNPPNYNQANAGFSGHVNYAAPQTQIVLAAPPSHTGGIFLDEDRPVVVQPGAVSSGPAGALEYLRNVSTLVVKQKIELLEIIANFDTANRFTVLDEAGRVVFYALEDSDFCDRICFGPARPFRMKILDVFQNEVININRPLACQSCCCFCCLMNVEVSSPPGNNVGKVQQKWSLITPTYNVENAVGETVLRIEGPCWRCSCGGDIHFKILSADGLTEVGKISKTWAGFGQEYFTDADNFKITFPPSLDVGVKATLVGALFLIDIMYFERKKNN